MSRGSLGECVHELTIAGWNKKGYVQTREKSGPNFPCFFNKIFLNQTFINIKSFKISKTVPPEPSQGQFLL